MFCKITEVTKNIKHILSNFNKYKMTCLLRTHLENSNLYYRDYVFVQDLGQVSQIMS